MAEFALATGIIQVAAVGISLVKELYDFSTNACSAAEQVEFVAKNVSLYSTVLRALGKCLELKRFEATVEAEEVALEVHDQSNNLFTKIRNLLPPCREDGSISSSQKLAWSFRKSRVDYLVSQLEYLKSTVGLLLHILASAPKLREFRSTENPSTSLREEVVTNVQEGKNLLFEHCMAYSRAKTTEIVRDEFVAIESDEGSSLHTPNADLQITSKTPSHQLVVPRDACTTLSTIQTQVASLSAAESRQLALSQSSTWLAQLHKSWTCMQHDTDNQTDSLNAVDVSASGLDSLGHDVRWKDDAPGVITDTPPTAASTQALRQENPPRAEQAAPLNSYVEPEAFDVTFYGGYDFDNCNAYIPLSHTLDDLFRARDERDRANLNLESATLKKDLASMARFSNRISELDARVASLTEEHQQYEVGPLRRAYTKEVLQHIARVDGMLEYAYGRRSQAARYGNFPSEKMLAEVVIPELTYQRHWLFDSIKRHRIWRLPNDRLLRIGPTSSRPVLSRRAPAKDADEFIQRLQKMDFSDHAERAVVVFSAAENDIGNPSSYQTVANGELAPVTWAPELFPYMPCTTDFLIRLINDRLTSKERSWITGCTACGAKGGDLTNAWCCEICETTGIIPDDITASRQKSKSPIRGEKAICRSCKGRGFHLRDQERICQSCHGLKIVLDTSPGQYAGGTGASLLARGLTRALNTATPHLEQARHKMTKKKSASQLAKR